MRSPDAPSRRWKCALCLLAVTAALALCASPGAYLPALARFLDISERPEAVDYLLVLGGGNGNRPFAAAALYGKGLARQVLLPTATAYPDAADGLTPSEHEIDRRVLRASGVPEDAIVPLAGTHDSTHEEAAALARFLADRPSASVAIVTTTYHTRRARLIFRSVLGGRPIRILGAPTNGYDASNWWRFEQGVSAYASEYVKLALVWLRQAWLGLTLVVMTAATLVWRLRAVRRRHV